MLNGMVSIKDPCRFIFELSYEEVIKYAKDNNFYDSTYEKLNLLINNDKPTIEFYKSLL